MSSESLVENTSSVREDSFLNDPRIRSIFYQLVVFVAVIGGIYWIVDNTITNLQRANIASGFGFLKGRAGFDISQTLIEYNNNSTYGRALLVGFLNTLYVAFLGVILASILGFLIGVGRLSHNWIIRKISTIYVEVFRNIPPLLVIFFWYFGVLSVLPQARESMELPLNSYLNNRGLFFPAIIWGDNAGWIGIAFIAAIILTVLVRFLSKKRQERTGQGLPTVKIAIALIIGLPLLTFFALGAPISFDYPKLGTFSLAGGAHIKPEFMSLFLALSFYTAAFIAEIVRAGVLGVPNGQSEAAEALGLRRPQTLRLVVIPQAMRIIIPPLSSQYLNLIKNSSLAIAIGYPDLVAVGGTILNQTGQSIEVVAIWMAIYLSISLIVSGFMNWFNNHMALVER